MTATVVFLADGLPTAVVGVAYDQPIGVKSFTTAVSASAVASGALPDGLAINADHMRITGTPTKTGTFTFTLSLTDSGGTATSGSMSMTVTSNPRDAGLTFGSAPAATLVARLAPLTVD